MITLLQIALGLAAALTLGGLVCRIGPMTWRTHQHAVIVMHIGLAMGSAWALFEAVQGRISPAGVGSVMAAAGWLWVSLPTWRDGPPAHTLTQPRELAWPELESVVGGHKGES